VSDVVAEEPEESGAQRVGCTMHLPETELRLTAMGSSALLGKVFDRMEHRYLAFLEDKGLEQAGDYMLELRISGVAVPREKETTP
jgi:hypothetical protein